MQEIIAPKNVSQEDLRDQIDFDLEQLEHQVRRPGWSSWALFGAIGYCIWIGASLLESAAVDFTTATTAAAALVMISDSLVVLLSLLSPDQPAIGMVHRFRLMKEELDSERVFILVLLIRAGFVVYCTVSFMGAYVSWEQHVVGGAYSAFALLLLLSFVFSYVPWPVPHQSGDLSKKAILAILALGCVLAVASIRMALAVAENGFGYAVVNWKVGGLIWVLFSLLLFLVKAPPHSTLAPPLVELRRRIVLRTISMSEAEETYNTIRAGMRVDSVLQAWIARVLEKCQMLEESVEDMLRTYNGYIDRDKDGALNDEDADFFRNTSERFKKNEAQAKDSISGYKRMMQVFDIITGGMVNSDPDCIDEISAARARVEGHVSQSMARARATLKELSDKRLMVQKLVKGEVSEET